MAVTPWLAAVLVTWPLPFEDLFFNMFSAAVQAILWFLACWLGLRFEWRHAAAVGLIAVVTIAPTASSSVDSISRRFLNPDAARAAAPTPAGSPASATPAAPSN
jgi:hypothetical protein